MKSILKLVFALFVGSQIAACSSSSGIGAADTVCSSYYGSTITCSNGGTLQACANSTDAWYEINGSYICSYQYSTSCVQTAVNACNAKTSPTEKLLMEELLKSTAENVKLQQGVNQSYINLGNEIQQQNQ